MYCKHGGYGFCQEPPATSSRDAEVGYGDQDPWEDCPPPRPRFVGGEQRATAGGYHRYPGCPSAPRAVGYGDQHGPITFG